MFKIIFSLIFFYFLALFQTSFLVHYEVGGGLLNLVLVSVILFSFFEKKESKSCLFIGAIAGFYLDIFSPLFPGLFTLLGIGIAFLVKLLKPFFETKRYVSFIIIFLGALLFYEIVLTLSMIGKGFYFNIFGLFYNLVIGSILYYLIKTVYAFRRKAIKK